MARKIVSQQNGPDIRGYCQEGQTNKPPPRISNQFMDLRHPAN